MDERLTGKRSFALVDPDLHDFLAVFDTPVDDQVSLAELREQANGFFAANVGTDDIVLRSAVRIEASRDGPGGSAFLYVPRRPASRPRPIYMHIHGGGFLTGAPEMYDARHRQTADALDCAVFAPAYRLAPEHVFPAALDDCRAALGWLRAQGGSHGLDSGRIVIGGESAGGGLAASLTLWCRDQGDFEPAGQVLIYPMLDDRTCLREDMDPFAGEFVWTAEHNAIGWRSMLGTAPGSEEVSPYAAAARAPDLGGLPPTFITTAALDLFRDENLDYAARLCRAGVPTEFRLYGGAFHGFDLDPDAAVARRAVADVRTALAEMFARDRR